MTGMKKGKVTRREHLPGGDSISRMPRAKCLAARLTLRPWRAAASRRGLDLAPTLSRPAQVLLV